MTSLCRSPLPAACALALAALLPAGAAKAQTFDMYNYWLMPHTLTANMTTIWWQKPGCPTGTGTGQHSFWRGSLWGRTVALQGDPSMLRYDIFVDAGTQLQYWGTFRGLNYSGTASDHSHSFDTPFVFVDKTMALGAVKQQSVPVEELHAQMRKVSSASNVTMRTQVDAHYPTWQDPNSGIVWSDVLQFTFWSAYNPSNPNASKEVYHLAKGKGTVRFETFNSGEPSCVRIQYANSFQNITPQPVTLPWFDPFKNAAFVANGFAEDFLTTPVNGGAIGTYLRSWSGSSPDVVITTDGTQPPGGSGPWKIALRGSTGGGDAVADAAFVSSWIPVTSGKTYRVSGRVWRVSSADNVYLDFNDGLGVGGNFSDAHATASTVNTWQYVQAQTNVGAATSIKIRAVRDGANQGNAYFDWIQIQRVD